ncbi:AraC family transcriptional regulator [Desertivirga brevis]|uniref:AraC family transcriptional regulator n=1 Tax=Desertivirga brevis TaxID=2810310 RepID=UPI001A95B6A6|nr:AraC family transcriptional regulator [Pedobacter sp. SYSU D00873]
MKKESLNDYCSRVNKAIDFIRLNLDTNISLDELAERVNLSKFHFLRVFHAVTGVSPGEYHKQLRMQRTQFQLISHSEISVTQIAYQLGFSSVSALCKSFKKTKKTSPLEWRAHYLRKHSNSGHFEKNKDEYFRSIFNLKYNNMEKQHQFKCQVKELRDQKVIYIRNFSIHVHDSEGFKQMFERLFEWAGSRGLLNFPATKALTVYRSMPDENGMLQADVCLTVPEGVLGEGEIGTTIIPGGTYAVIYKEGTLDECFSAWDYLYNSWLPASGFSADSRGVFLNHLNDSGTHPEGLHIFEMCVSVQKI